jgi:hypothetical protein
LDIALMFDEALQEDAIFGHVTAISLELTTLLRLDVSVLPILRDQQKPMLYYNAVAKGIAVFVKEAPAYARFRREVIDDMEDFQIFGTRWQIDAARKNLAHGRV